MRRWFSLIAFLCVLGAADVPGIIGFVSSGGDCGDSDCGGGTGEEDCNFDCGLCPFCPLRSGEPEVAVIVPSIPTQFTSFGVPADPLRDAVPVEVFRPPLS